MFLQFLISYWENGLCPPYVHRVVLFASVACSQSPKSTNATGTFSASDFPVPANEPSRVDAFSDGSGDDVSPTMQERRPLPSRPVADRGRRIPSIVPLFGGTGKGTLSIPQPCNGFLLLKTVLTRTPQSWSNSPLNSPSIGRKSYYMRRRRRTL